IGPARLADVRRVSIHPFTIFIGEVSLDGEEYAASEIDLGFTRIQHQTLGAQPAAKFRPIKFEDPTSCQSPAAFFGPQWDRVADLLPGLASVQVSRQQRGMVLGTCREALRSVP